MVGNTFATDGEIAKKLLFQYGRRWSRAKVEFLAQILVLYIVICMTKIVVLCFLIRPKLTNLSLFKNLSIANNGNIYRDDVIIFGMIIDKGQIHILRSNLDTCIFSQSQGRYLWNNKYYQKLWQKKLTQEYDFFRIILI